MTNKERIDAYFDNGLSPAEKEDFLRQLEQDPSLKSEFEFQQEIVDGIKEFRKQELIARLDNVKIASTGQSVLLKTIGMLGTAAIITGGLFWYFSPSEEIEPTTDAVVVEIERPTLDTSSTTEELIPADKNEGAETPVVKEVTSPAKTIEKEELISEKSVPKVVVPEMQEPGDDRDNTMEEDLTAPEAMASEAISIKTATDVAVKLDKKYKFHYQVTSGNLTLYGDFSDFPFEVIELKTSQGISSYLYYKSFFYELADDSDEIRPLVAIENQALIDQLKKRR